MACRPKRAHGSNYQFSNCTMQSAKRIPPPFTTITRPPACLKHTSCLLRHGTQRQRGHRGCLKWEFRYWGGGTESSGPVGTTSLRGTGSGTRGANNLLYMVPALPSEWSLFAGSACLQPTPLAPGSARSAHLRLRPLLYFSKAPLEIINSR